LTATAHRVGSELLASARAASRLPKPAHARAIREGAGLTQSELADAIAVHRVTLGRWETGQAVPRGRARARYAQTLLELQQAIAS
jgi:DNA-binding transcriptional regulator YiaG